MKREQCGYNLFEPRVIVARCDCLTWSRLCYSICNSLQSKTCFLTLHPEPEMLQPGYRSYDICSEKQPSFIAC